FDLAIAEARGDALEHDHGRRHEGAADLKQAWVTVLKRVPESQRGALVQRMSERFLLEKVDGSSPEQRARALSQSLDAVFGLRRDAAAEQQTVDELLGR
ncbi:MAG: hypothetical protein AAFX50_22725, partial [Acidobacteriota bacterium]